MQFLDVIFFGAVAVAVGLLLLGAIIAELRLKAGRPGLFIGIGLGTGIMAFVAKLGLIIAYAIGGDAYLHAFLPANLKPEPYAAPQRKNDPFIPGNYRWEPLPLTPPTPKDNPQTPSKIALGKRLFHDPRLSADGSVACASCHDLKGKAGADGRAVSVGIGGQTGTRNAPTVLNAAYQGRLFWDGRAASLEDQAIRPLLNPEEMGMPGPEAVVERVSGIPEYRMLFAEAFGQEQTITIETIAQSIAAYERTLVTPNTAYDRFVRGESGAMSRQQVRGMGLFTRFGCIRCHGGPNFSDASLFGSGASYRVFPAVAGTEYEKRYRLTEDKGAAAGQAGARSGIWRIPSLRNVTLTAPYFHNGSVETLEEAVRIMARVQLDTDFSNDRRADWSISWNGEQKQVRAEPNAVISDVEILDIVAFLRALEGEVQP